MAGSLCSSHSALLWVPSFTSGWTSDGLLGLCWAECKTTGREQRLGGNAFTLPAVYLSYCLDTSWTGPPSQPLTHEVEVALAAQAVGEQPDHLVQLDAAIDDRRHRHKAAHVGVHLLVHEPKGQRLVSNKSLEGDG